MVVVTIGSAPGELGETRFVADARAARDVLAKRAHLPPRELVLLGRSMGSAVAVTLAAEGGARGLILECAFSTLPEVTRRFHRWAPLRLPMRNVQFAKPVADSRIAELAAGKAAPVAFDYTRAGFAP